MNYIPYNSRLGYHKSKFGAVKEDEEMVFRLVMPRSFGVSAMYLVIFRDSEKEKNIINLTGKEWKATAKNGGVFPTLQAKKVFIGTALNMTLRTAEAL